MTFEALKRRRTKIVATLGPASTDPSMIGRLIAAGADVFRLNFSHGDHATHEAAFHSVRDAAASQGAPIAVLADMSGPKLRVGTFEGGGISLSEGNGVIVTTRAVKGNAAVIPSQYERLASDVSAGSRILLSDGLVELCVDSVDGEDAQCHVVRGGEVLDKQGLNLPDANVSVPAVTDKDRSDVAFAIELGVDLVAQSFVRFVDDVATMQSLLPATGGPRLIAKIERRSALVGVDAILDVADGIMVARGDLGVELPPEEVPVAQRDLVAAARQHSKPVIVATQMLESMREHPMPTRAEVSDVSTAVFSGADAVMLSAETASGRYPVEAVAMMDRICRQVEGHLWAEGRFQGASEPRASGTVPIDKALARAMAQLTRDLRIRAIVAFTSSGATAAAISSARPAAPLLAVSADPAIVRQMTLLWGVIPVVADGEGPEIARKLAVEHGLADRGQHLLAAQGFTSDPMLTVLLA